MKKLICPKCGGLDSPVIKHALDRRLDYPYNMCRDSDDWYDLLSDFRDDEGKAVVYCCYCEHEGDISTFEVEEVIKRDFEIMIPYMQSGIPKIEYFKCKDYTEFQSKIKELAKKEAKYVDMINVNPICRINDYSLNWDGIHLSEVMKWKGD